MALRIALLLFLFLPCIAGAAAPPDFVTADGPTLTLNGNPYKFIGVNRYNLLTTGGYPYIGCGAAWTRKNLDEWFAEVHHMGGTAVRFWAFQSFTMIKNQPNFDQMDYIVNTLAPKYNIRIIATLENEWGDCSLNSGKKMDGWYESGYLSPYGGYALSFKDYANVIVSRYKNSPYILMWQLMNEAEDDSPQGNCASGENLYNFTVTMSSYIKSLDPDHMVNLGTIGGTQCGTQTNQLFQRLYGIPAIDIVEAHDYGAESQPLPGYPIPKGSVSSSVASDFLVVAHNLHKPFFIGEAGIQAEGCTGTGCVSLSKAVRAAYFSAKMQALFSNGGVGYLIWSYRDNSAAVDYFSFDVADPLYSDISHF